MALTIRLLTPNDLTFAQEVRTIASWNQTDRDWLRLINAAPDGCFLIECDGKSAGTATTTSYGTDLAWIGMVLVHPDFRRRGLATALLEHCLHHLREEKGVACVKLDATPDGQKVYEKLGFKAEYELARWEGNRIKGATIRGDLFDSPTYPPLDREAFGTDRSVYLDLLSRDCEACLQQDQSLGMIRPGSRASYLGPVVSDHSQQACALIRTLLTSPDSGLVYWDIPEDHTEAIALARELGFVRQRPLIRMWTGQPLMDRREWQWAIGSPETG